MNKVWFVTGAGSGIGAGIAKATLRAGDHVVATGRDPRKLKAAYNDIAAENVVVLSLNVTDEVQAKTAVDDAVKRFGRIDVLVNNAGYSILGNFEATTTSELERQFATNFYGVANVMRAVLPVMRRQRSGHIFNISSVAGVVGLKHCSAYASTARSRRPGPRPTPTVTRIPNWPISSATAKESPSTANLLAP